MTAMCHFRAETPVTIGWHPGYRPSNGTEGSWWESKVCRNCTREHENHGPHGVTGPGCPIFMSSMAGINAYPNRGPAEWEVRWPGGGQGFGARCTEFEQCAPCAADAEAERLKVWPIEVGTALKPRKAHHVVGQIGLGI